MPIMVLVLALGLSCSASAASAQPPQQTDRQSDPQRNAQQQTQSQPDQQADQQTDQPDGGQIDRKAPPPTPEHTGFHALAGNLVEDIKLLPAKQNLYLALVGGGLAAAVHPADQYVNVHLRNHYDTVNTIFAPGKYVGDTPEQVAASIGAYVFGRIFDQPKVSHLGMDLIQAQLITEAMVEPLKLAVHRARPDGSNNQSFPSGHAAVTFASATVIERHLGWKKSILGYGIASYVAMSRLHDNRHYLSDVVFGAAVGSIAGRTVVHHGADYWAMTPVALPGGGMAVYVTKVNF